MYQIEYTLEAVADLKSLKKSEQGAILDAIDVQLRYEPTVETRNRKQMRPNAIAQWELRIGQFRVLYNVETAVRVVDVRRIGKKQRNLYLFRGQQEDLQ